MAVVILAAGCTGTVSGRYPTELAPQVMETTAFVNRVAEVYGVRSVSLVIGSQVEGLGAYYSRGTLFVGTLELRSPNRDALLAHEMAHYLLEHEFDIARQTNVRAMQEEREQQANLKSVEVLARAKGISEYEALAAVYAYLRTVHALVKTNQTVIPWGHKLPCVEIADLLSAFSQYRERTARWECAPTIGQRI